MPEKKEPVHVGDEFTTSRPGLYSSHGAAASERHRPQSRSTSTSTRTTSTAPRRAARSGISMCPGGPAAWATGPSPGWPPRRHPAAPEPERPVAGSGGTDRPLPAGSPPSRWAAPMADTDCRTVAIPTPRNQGREVFGDVDRCSRQPGDADIVGPGETVWAMV